MFCALRPVSKTITIAVTALTVLLLSACASTPRPQSQSQSHSEHNTGPKAGSSLPDRAAFLQTDQRWSAHTLGGAHESLREDGCLVTAAAMALVNLGFQTDPGDLTNRLKAYNGFTKNGWLIWSGLERATAGRAKVKFFEHGDANTVRACLASGYYPLVRFRLKSGTPHWAVVIQDAGRSGFMIRDPMIASQTPIPLSLRTNGFNAVRCIGMNRA